MSITRPFTDWLAGIFGQRRYRTDQSHHYVVRRRNAAAYHLDGMFRYLTKLQWISFGCKDTGRYHTARCAHQHDDGICILEDGVEWHDIYDLNPDGYMVPSTLMLHEYAHLTSAAEFHHHGKNWRRDYVRFCENFDLDPGYPLGPCSGEWGSITR